MPMTPDAVAKHLAAIQQQRDHYTASVIRFGSTDNLAPALFVDFDRSVTGSITQAWVSLRQGDESSIVASRLTQVLIDVSVAFGAYRGVIEDELLMQLYRGPRAAERARDAVPEDLRRYVPEPVELQTGPPTLLVPQEFDRRRVPDAVWWINYWDSVQVEELGWTAIQDAGFASIERQPSGAAVLTATEAPLDPTNPEHLSQLARIVTRLQLRARQENARR
jgi:hypothetical protein